MATSASNAAQKDENLETYCLIWLDASVNSSKQNIDAQKQLRASINHLLTFEDDQQCLQYIDTLPKDDRTVLIVSGRLGRTVVPKIVQFRQIVSIYVYCMDKEANEKWTLQFPKVKGVIVRLDDLIRQIQTDQTQQQHQKVDEALPMSIFKSDAHAEGQSSTGLSGQFIHFQLLIDCLIRMKPSSNEKQEFIAFCKQHYEDNPTDLKVIEEFERDYVPKKSLWWYTRHSFLFRLLNKALRVQNIDLLYLFRFFIRDLKQELENKKCSSPVHVYRAQRISKDEIKMLQQSIGEYISMNSFFSTSLDREQARSFFSTGKSSDDVEEVFFKIDADPRLDNIKPFGNITSVSYFPGEEEVLFMIGSIFQVVEMKCDSDRIWNILMKVCSENGHRLQALFQHMKKTLGTESTNLLRFGQVLHDMGKLNDAEKYVRLYFGGLPPDHPSIAGCYQALGMVADAKGEYEVSLKWYNKALDITMKTVGSNHCDVATIHNCVGEAHRKKGDYALARESYKKSLKIRIQLYGQDHLHVGACLNNMALVYQREEQYSKALEIFQAALMIFEKHLPADHSNLGRLHNNIGIIHRCLGNYDEALKHYNLDLNISRKSLPPEHPSIAETLLNISLTHEAKSDFQQALAYYEKAATIFDYSLSSTHPNVIKIGQAIKRVSSKLK